MWYQDLSTLLSPHQGLKAIQSYNRLLIVSLQSSQRFFSKNIFGSLSSPMSKYLKHHSNLNLFLRAKTCFPDFLIYFFSRAQLSSRPKLPNQTTSCPPNLPCLKEKLNLQIFFFSISSNIAPIKLFGGRSIKFKLKTSSIDSPKDRSMRVDDNWLHLS